MTDKILEAVKELGGDIKNTAMYCGEIDGYIDLDRGTYCVERDEFPTTICTVSEFNAAAAEWLKEAYMHNAAIDLGWDVTNACEYVASDKHLVIYKGRYVTRQSLESSPSLSPYMPISTTQEFIDYCAANKPRSQIGTPEEKEALDMIEAKHKTPSKKMKRALDEVREIEAKLSSDSAQCNSEVLLTVGDYVRIDGKSIGGVLRAIFLDDQGIKNAAVELEDGACVSLGLWRVEPIKSPRDKAVEAISKAPKYRMPESKAAEVYDWLKSLTPEQKKEFGL